MADNSENLTLWGSFATGGTITRTANYATAPNGTMTATRIQNSGGSVVQWTYQDINLINGGTISMYVKRTGSTNQTFRLFGNNGAEVSSNFTATSEWQRFEFTILPSGSTKPHGITTDSSANAADILVWGGQINIGSTAKPYFPTTDRLNVPRLTYQNGGGGCPSLLLEKQSTNVNTYSNNISNASYNYQNASVSGITTTSPDGTSNSFGIVADTSSNNFHRWYKSFGALSGTYTTSIYAKKGTSKYLGIGWNSDGSTGNNNIVVYDLDAGTISSNIYSITASIESVGNGWYKCIHTFNFGTGGSFADLCVHNAGLLSNYTAAAFQVYDTPSVSTTLYLWGIQVEASSYATSLIETTSASATRVADTCFKTGISSLIGQTSGVLFADLVFLNPEPMFFLSIVGTDWYQDSIYFELANSTNYISVASVKSSTGAGSANSTIAPTANSRYKIAVQYSGTAFNLYINGTKFSGTRSANSLCSKLYLNELGTLASTKNNLQTKFNEVVTFTTALSDAECISLTTI
jgi:hypothetical protein